MTLKNLMPVLTLLGLILLVVMLIFAGAYFAAQNITPEVKLPLLAITGVIVLLAGLALVAMASPPSI